MNPNPSPATRRPARRLGLRSLSSFGEGGSFTPGRAQPVPFARQSNSLQAIAGRDYLKQTSPRIGNSFLNQKHGRAGHWTILPYVEKTRMVKGKEVKHMKCAKCDKETEGWKCAVCGEESDSHDDSHTHGEPASSRHCMPKCQSCSQAEVHCSC